MNRPNSIVSFDRKDLITITACSGCFRPIRVSFEVFHARHRVLCEECEYEERLRIIGYL